MKILALEKETKTVDWGKETQTLVEEAKAVYNLYQTGHLREIYFTENKNAILIFECESVFEACQILSKLPLVQKGIIDFDLLELKPYTGLSRLMNLD